MRIVFAVFFLLIAYVASYPSYRDGASDNDENDFELELRSILNQLDEEQMTRSLGTDDDSDDDDDDAYAFSKRQGGNNMVDKQSECEIKCIYSQRNPAKGKGKSIKEASKACKTICPNPNKKRGQKKTNVQKKEKSPNQKLNLREFIDDDDSSNSNEEQQIQRRELYDYLMEQLQQNNDE